MNVDRRFWLAAAIVFVVLALVDWARAVDISASGTIYNSGSTNITFGVVTVTVIIHNDTTTAATSVQATASTSQSGDWSASSGSNQTGSQNIPAGGVVTQEIRCAAALIRANHGLATGTVASGGAVNYPLPSGTYTISSGKSGWTTATVNVVGSGSVNKVTSPTSDVVSQGSGTATVHLYASGAVPTPTPTPSPTPPSGKTVTVSGSVWNPVSGGGGLSVKAEVYSGSTLMYTTDLGSATYGTRFDYSFGGDVNSFKGTTIKIVAGGVEVGSLLVPVEQVENLSKVMPTYGSDPNDPYPTPAPIPDASPMPTPKPDNPDISGQPSSGNGGATTGTVASGGGGVTSSTGGISVPSGGYFPGAGTGPTPNPSPSATPGEGSILVGFDYGEIRGAVKYGELDAWKQDSGISTDWADPALADSKDSQVQTAADGLSTGLTSFATKGQQMVNSFKGLFEKFKLTLSAPDAVSVITMPLPGHPLVIDLSSMPYRSVIRSFAGFTLILFGVIAGTRLLGQLFVA